MDDSLFGGGRRSVAVFSRECMAELLNLPPGTMITGIEWEDNRRLFRVGVEGASFGTLPPEEPFEIPDLRVSHYTHHKVEWPLGNVQVIDFRKDDPENPTLSGGTLNLGPRLSQPSLPPVDDNVPEDKPDEENKQ